MLTGVLFDNIELDQNRISRIVRIRYSDAERISFHSIMSGTPDGILLIQVSEDPTEDEALVTNWIDYTDSEVSVLGMTQILHNLRDLSFRWIKLVYVHANSTGFITTNFTLIKRAKQ